MEETQIHTENEADKKFRRERQWASFKGVLYAGLGTAAFIGVLQKVVNLTVDAVANSTGTVAESAVKAAAMLADPLVLATMGGFMAVGTAFTYLAQKEWTDVKFMEDEQLARKNAICIQQEKTKAKALEMAEHPENQRADGKKWLEVVGGKDTQVAHGTTR